MNIYPSVSHISHSWILNEHNANCFFKKNISRGVMRKLLLQLVKALSWCTRAHWLDPSNSISNLQKRKIVKTYGLINGAYKHIKRGLYIDGGPYKTPFGMFAAAGNLEHIARKTATAGHQHCSLPVCYGWEATCSSAKDIDPQDLLGGLVFKRNMSTSFSSARHVLWNKFIANVRWFDVSIS